MSMGGPGDGLSLDQAPPLSIPGSFFLTAPLSVVASGSLLLYGMPALITPVHPATIALTHLGTLGFLAMVMLGAMYQMLPVVASSPVPTPRSAHVVHLSLSAGVLALVVALLAALPALMGLAMALLGVAFTVFVVGVGLALVRAPHADATVWGMRLSLASLVALACLGLAAATGHAGYSIVAATVRQAHYTVALLGWVGGLIGAVSLKVVPMFYLAPPPLSQRNATVAVAVVAASLASTLAALAVGAGGQILALVATPAAMVVWCLHPAAVLLSLSRRKRKRPDASLMFWRAGLATGAVGGCVALASVLWPSDSVRLLAGWLLIWGWAGAIIHGMLYKIAPFLVWFHRMSPFVGVAPVPPAKRLVPDVQIRMVLVAHQLSLVLGAAAIYTGSIPLSRLCGAALALTGVVLLYGLGCLARVRAPVLPPDPTTARLSSVA